MESFSPINKEVTVNSYYFTKQTRTLKSFPHEIEVDGHDVTFVDSGLSFLIKKGQGLVRLFDMNDGNSTYRLRLEDNQWALVGMKVGIV